VFCLLSLFGCSIATHNLYERIQVYKAMPNVNIKTPDWFRHMENILEELNEGVAILEDQLASFLPKKR
jgi:hypothetical protein